MIETTSLRLAGTDNLSVRVAELREPLVRCQTMTVPKTSYQIPHRTPSSRCGNHPAARSRQSYGCTHNPVPIVFLRWRSSYQAEPHQSPPLLQEAPLQTAILAGVHIDHRAPHESISPYRARSHLDRHSQERRSRHPLSPGIVARLRVQEYPSDDPRR